MAAKPKKHWSPPWVALVAAIGSAVAVLAVRYAVVPIMWWGLPGICVAGLVATMFVLLATDFTARAHVLSVVAWGFAGGWMWWATLGGWSTGVWSALVIGAVVLTGMSYWAKQPVAVSRMQVDGPGFDRRPGAVKEWEALLRRRTRGAALVVTAVVPWANRADGERVYVDLPEEGDVTPQTIADACQGIAIAKKLPPGCTVRVLDGDDHQGQVVLDVMLRDCLTDEVTVEDDFSPASVYDSFQVATTPRGESLDVCLRSQSMVIGGAPDSGKTTLLHRIILRLARCVDALIWVVDTNGGGVATPWVRPWAMSYATRPIVDWIAADEEEAAVLVAVAAAIAKDRKTSPEATRRRHGSDTTVLPVDADLPAIVVLNDEGGEMRQAVSLLGQLADQGISRLAQIGRAEGVRAIKSVLRGTSDLLDKGMRVCAALRIALRMEEDDEYVHVLGAQPPKGAQLLHKGTGFIRRPGDRRPILLRTVNVLLSQIERAAIECAGLRPDLDVRAQRVAAKVRVVDVLGGRQASDEIMALPVMGDVEAGRAYSGRWDRFADRLAAMRGEDLPDLEDVDEPGPVAPRSAPVHVSAPGSAVSALLAAAGMGPSPAPAVTAPRPAVDVADVAAVNLEAARLLGQVDWTSPPRRHAVPEPVATEPKMTLREHVLMILSEAYPAELGTTQILARLRERGQEPNRTYLQTGVLKPAREAGEILRGQAGYTVPKGEGQ